MVNGQGTAIAVPAGPTSSDRHKAPTPLLQADITGLELTRLLSLDGLHSPIIRTAISYWMSKQQGGTPMQRAQFDATEIPHLLPYLLLLEVVSTEDKVTPGKLTPDKTMPDKTIGVAKPADAADDDLALKELNGHRHHGPKMDFRYRVIGDVVLRYSRGNYTGRCFSEVEGQGPGSEVWRICTAVAEQARPLLLCPPYVGPHHHIFYCESATMPLVDESGKTVRLLIACDFLPEASLGQPHHNGHGLNSVR